jgi:hypothetical protein
MPGPKLDPNVDHYYVAPPSPAKPGDPCARCGKPPRAKIHLRPPPAARAQPPIRKVATG